MYDLIFPKMLLNSSSCWSPWQQRRACTCIKQIAWMQKDIRFSGRSLKFKYRWRKDVLQEKLCLLRCDNITYGTAARGSIYKYKEKNSSTKNLQDICRSFIISISVMSMFHECLELLQIFSFQHVLSPAENISCWKVLVNQFGLKSKNQREVWQCINIPRLLSIDISPAEPKSKSNQCSK